MRWFELYTSIYTMAIIEVFYSINRTFVRVLVALRRREQSVHLTWLYNKIYANTTQTFDALESIDIDSNLKNIENNRLVVIKINKSCVVF